MEEGSLSKWIIHCGRQGCKYEGECWRRAGSRKCTPGARQGSDWPCTKGNERERENELFGIPPFRQQRCFSVRLWKAGHNRVGRRCIWRLCRYTCWKHMLSVPMRGWLISFLFFLFFKKRVSNVQHFRLPVSRCEGLFICGTLFLLIIAQESQSVTPSLSLSQVFQTIFPQTLDTWLADFRAEISGGVCVSFSLF